MKKLAIAALCFFSSLASANDVEEIVIIAKKLEITMIKISDTHKQNPLTGNWHYVEKKKEKNKA